MEKRPRILCVDDEVNVLKALERTFLDDDYDIVTATSGEEGLKVLADDAPVQVVISDYRMPAMSGVEFLGEVCRRWPDIIRIVLSGYADITAVISAVNEGEIYRFIPKPWDEESLRETVANAVDRFYLTRIKSELAEELKAKNEELSRINWTLEQLLAANSTRRSHQGKGVNPSQRILDALPVGVLSTDMNGTVVQCNPEGARLLDLQTERAVGGHRRDLFPEELNLLIDRTAEAGATLKGAIRNGTVRVVGVGISGPDQQGIILVLESERL